MFDQSLVGRADTEIAAVCATENRAIVTLDLDFSDIRTYPPASYAGIVVLRVSRQEREHVLSVCREMIRLLDTEELVGTLWIVEDSRVRIWRGS